jgi:hypothetical protein
MDPYTGVVVYDIHSVFGDNLSNVWTFIEDKHEYTMTPQDERDSLQVI